MKYILFLLFMASVLSANAQDSELNFTKSFLIIKSTKSYNKALKKAQLACNDLGITLNLRNMHEDPKEGLTSSETCECGERHGYIPRGRYDDGEYISIEYSSSFEAFTPEYYIVVVSSGSRQDLNKMLPKVKQKYSDAYIKDSEVYMGCMH